MTNTEILLFVLGYQGGTIHQLAMELGVTDREIFGADHDKMLDLCRLAQAKHWQRIKNVWGLTNIGLTSTK